MVYFFKELDPVRIRKTGIFEQSRKDRSLYVTEDSLIPREEVALFLVEKPNLLEDDPTNFCSILGLYVADSYGKVPEAIDSLIQVLKKHNCCRIWYDATDIEKYQSEKMPDGRLLKLPEILKCFADAQCHILNNEMIELQPNHRR